MLTNFPTTSYTTTSIILMLFRKYICLISSCYSSRIGKKFWTPLLTHFSKIRNILIWNGFAFHPIYSILMKVSRSNVSAGYMINNNRSHLMGKCRSWNWTYIENNSIVHIHCCSLSWRNNLMSISQVVHIDSSDSFEGGSYSQRRCEPFDFDYEYALHSHYSSIPISISMISLIGFVVWCQSTLNHTLWPFIQMNTSSTLKCSKMWVWMKCWCCGASLTNVKIVYTHTFTTISDMFVFARELLRIRFCLFHQCIRVCVCVWVGNRVCIRQYTRCHNTENVKLKCVVRWNWYTIRANPADVTSRIMEYWIMQNFNIIRRQSAVIRIFVFLHFSVFFFPYEYQEPACRWRKCSTRSLLPPTFDAITMTWSCDPQLNWTKNRKSIFSFF